jgi:hypothetical protein
VAISLPFLAPDLVKAAAIDGRLPHGMGVARLTDMPRRMVAPARDPGTSWKIVGIRTVSLQPRSLFPRKRNFGARDKGHQTSLNQRRQVSRAHAIARQPANSRLFAPLQEISPKAGVRGGPGRTQTSNQTVMARPPRTPQWDIFD